MLAFVARRLALMVPTLFAISLVSFAIIQLPPGDYATTLVSQLEDSGQTVGR